ncbi:FAD-dependent oxidoreductase, partial [Turicimonas muris]
WLEGMGLKFRPDVMQVYGALWPRSHLATEPKGTGFIRVLSDKCKALGVDILTGTKLEKIIRENFDEGRALGVLAIRNGKPFYIRATKGIVLAAGGFAANPKLRALHDPRMLTLTTTNNSACSTGEVMLAANEAGAYLLGLDYIQCNPGCPPGHTSRQALHLDVARYIFVDKRGKRFVSEDARRDVLRDAILNLPEKFGYAIVDNDGFNSYNQIVRDDAMKGLKTGDAFTADTLDELAKKMDVPADQLKKTVAEYNAMVDKQKDPDFGKAPRNLTHKIEKAPYWAALSSMAVHHTMGGVRIDPETRVLDRQGNVIPGLYAAGEITGGIHGTNRLGGNAIADIFTFGRIAGNSAAKQK